MTTSTTTDAQRLRSLRKKLDMTQSEFAQLIGYSSPQAVANVESGQKGMSEPTRKLLDYIEKEATAS